MMPVLPPPRPKAFALPRRDTSMRTLFLSDLHLGTSRGKPQRVVDFLDHVRAETIFLVGDIFDGWNPGARRASPLPDHRLLLNRLDRFASDGTRVVLVPGNHDAPFRRHEGQMIGPMEVMTETEHTTADGRRYLVTHGDSADPTMALGDTIGWLGGQLDVVIRKMNRGLNRLIGAVGCAPCTLVERALMGINKAMHPRARYVADLTGRAKGMGMQGVICGHFHLPALSDFGGTTYANCGDWLDHFSAVTETETGALQLVHWPDPVALSRPGRLNLPARGLPAA